MTARSDITVTINQPIEKVAEAYSKAEYWEHVAKHLSPEPGELNSFSEGEAVLFEILPKSIMPEAAQAMISQDLKLKRVVTIGALDGDQAKHSFTGDVKGTPVDLAGEYTATRAGEATELAYELEAKVNIPFMGAALEPKVVEALEEICENEAKLTETWISENL